VPYCDGGGSVAGERRDGDSGRVKGGRDGGLWVRVVIGEEVGADMAHLVGKPCHTVTAEVASQVSKGEEEVGRIR
jgi:hypothetical protein